jgi:hypothetical protein
MTVQILYMKKHYFCITVINRPKCRQNGKMMKKIKIIEILSSRTNCRYNRQQSLQATVPSALSGTKPTLNKNMLNGSINNYRHFISMRLSGAEIYRMSVQDDHNDICDIFYCIYTDICDIFYCILYFVFVNRSSVRRLIRKQSGILHYPDCFTSSTVTKYANIRLTRPKTVIWTLNI